MRILFAYDGSKCSEAALDDVIKSGLPREGEALVLSVSEIWLPPVNGEPDEPVDPYIEAVVKRHRERGEKSLSEAAAYSRHAQERLQALLPGWKIRSDATYGSPAWEILTAADRFDPDLIFVGSHGHSAISRFFLGSISQKVLTEAKCSVRVARGRVEVESAPVRIAVAFDGSQGAKAAVESIAEREWGEGAEIRLIAALDSPMPTAIGRFIPPVAEWANAEVKTEHEWIRGHAEPELAKLRDRGLSADLIVVEGDPKNIITQNAEAWHADCIFAGANAFGSRVERFVLGSTSAAIAARAHCTVEVVRRHT